ncbi:MAG: hypothetical protein IPH26_09440 [Sterolibacteriaceae bacterium]|uniref:ABM domain-containing protein n=1 Tax=Candidatus Methylophosphatis roskildensis TaxID=2899263 RepID=A0A9D7HKK2_9PROT|nr:hypothetical protein [Candidatus Methylophosphatis roskildensis]MBK7238280.1 hypothetical protein [Sterolibacteriaceae bacterium]
MADTCCTLVPYFKVHPGKLGQFRALCDEFVAKTASEPKCLHYAFSFDVDNGVPPASQHEIDRRPC